MKKMQLSNKGHSHHYSNITIKSKRFEPSKYQITLTESLPEKKKTLFHQYEGNMNSQPNTCYHSTGRSLHEANYSIENQSTKSHFTLTKHTIDPKITERIRSIVTQVSKSKRIPLKTLIPRHNESNSSLTPGRILNTIKRNRILTPEPRMVNIKRQKGKRNHSFNLLTVINKKMEYTFNIKSKKFLTIPKGNMPMINTPTQMNNKIIRDFGIQNGEVSQDIEYSKTNMELTKKYLARRTNLFKTNTQNVIEAFDKLKVKAMQINSIEENDLDYDIFEDFYHKMNREEYNKKKKEKESRVAAKIDNKASKYADLVLQVNSKKYMNKKSNQERITELKIDYNNLRKKIALYNFTKSKLDIENENEIFDTVEKFKENKKEADVDLLLALRELGPPTFVKQKFKNNTVKKFNCISGLYLGKPT